MEWRVPLAVAAAIVMVLLGGPEDALRALERLGYDAWQIVGNWFRR